jgi:hypothetical protein
MGLTPALARSGCAQPLVENRELAPKTLELERGDSTGRKQLMELVLGAKLTHAYGALSQPLAAVITLKPASEVVHPGSALIR